MIKFRVDKYDGRAIRCGLQTRVYYEFTITPLASASSESSMTFNINDMKHFMRRFPSPRNQMISGSKHGPGLASSALKLKYSRPEEMKKDCFVIFRNGFKF